MNKMNTLLAVALTLTVSACNYSNEFTGNYNGTNAQLTAHSNNINKYCVALTLRSGSEIKSNFISASEVFDSRDLFATKSFNTKGTQCNANQVEYLVGNRSTTILGTSEVAETQTIGAYNCQTVFYTQYTYQERIAFDLVSNANDLVVGHFEGTGLVDRYTDRSRVSRYGNIWVCRQPLPPRPYPYPVPGPRPRPRP